MMKVFKWIFTGLMLGIFTGAFSQAPPQGISYQAVARNDDGSPLADTDLGVRISILANGPSGTLMVEEEHLVTTDSYGLFSLVIGQGEFTGGAAPSFDLLQWGVATYFLQVELDPGDGIWELMGVSQMLSVPYAFYAAKSGGDDDADPENELIQSLSIVNDSLFINEGGVNHIIDLGDAIGDTVGDECISLIQLTDNALNIVECGETYLIDLSPLLDDGDWMQGGGVVYNDADMIGIGTALPQSTLDVSGSVSYEVSQVEGPANILLDVNNHVIIANITNNDVTITLPSAVDCSGRVYTFKVISTGPPNNLFLVTSGTETIDLVDDVTVSGVSNTAFSIISDGANWWVINGSIVP